VNLQGRGHGDVFFVAVGTWTDDTCPGRSVEQPPRLPTFGAVPERVLSGTSPPGNESEETLDRETARAVEIAVTDREAA